MKEVERWYDERGLPLVVRVTPAVAHFDEALSDLGFGREGLTDVMVASLTSRETRDVRVSLSESPSRVWLDAEARLQGVSAGLEGSWSGIISRIRPPVGFAAIDVDGESVAAGFAVRDDDWVGLFEIFRCGRWGGRVLITTRGGYQRKGGDEEKALLEHERLQSMVVFKKGLVNGTAPGPNWLRRPEWRWLETHSPKRPHSFLERQLPDRG